MNTQNRTLAPNFRGFTLIELLTVIAIIAVLAAILFPIFGTVREQARQSNTMSSLNATYTGVRLYYEDEGRYPTTLFGYAEIADNRLDPPQRPLAASDDFSAVKPMNDIAGAYKAELGAGQTTLHKGYLYRDEMKDYNTFINSNDATRDNKAVTQVFYPINSPLGAGTAYDASTNTLTSGIPVEWKQAVPKNDPTYDPCVRGDAEYPDTGATGIGYSNTSKFFYRRDSMDIGPMLAPNGGVMRLPNGQVAYELHYSPDWTGFWGTNCDKDGNGAPRVTQLKYRNPPSERTVITYVTHHALVGNGSIMILLANGTARKISGKEAFDKLPLNYAR